MLAILGAASLECGAQSQAASGAGSGAGSASTVLPASSTAPSSTKSIYLQRQKDGSVLFTDRPAASGVAPERTWTVPADDPRVAEQKREAARQESRRETQAINERVQRQLERQQERDDALVLERLRLQQAQAQRDAEAARAELERERASPPLIVVVPTHRPPIGATTPMPGGIFNPRPPQVRPPAAPPASPSPSLCLSKTADCNPSSDPARNGFGGR